MGSHQHGRQRSRSHLHAVPSAGSATAGTWAHRPDPESDQHAAELADSTFQRLERDLAGSSPLEVELWMAELVDMWSDQVLDDGSDPVEVLSHLHIDRALAAPSPAARVMMGALATMVGDPGVAAWAAQAAHDLDRQGVRLPGWSKGLGERRFKRAAVMEHELDDGHTIMLAFAYPGGEQYTVAVYVDVNIGLRVKDLFVGAPMATVERTIAAQAQPGQTVDALDPAEARARIEQAFGRLDDMRADPEPWTGPPLDLDEIDDLRRWVEAHVATLPEGGVPSRRIPDDQVEIDDMVEEKCLTFLAARESAAVIERYGDDEVGHVASHLAEYALTSGGDPLRVSSSSVQVFLWSAVPDSGCFDVDDIALLVDVTTAWAAWALPQRGLDRYVAATVVAVAEASDRTAELLAVSDIRSPGDIMALMAAMTADGVALDDESAVMAWMDCYVEDVASGRREAVEPLDGLAGGPTFLSFGMVDPPELDERAPDLDRARVAAVDEMMGALTVPEHLRARAAAVLVELVRVCDAVFDGAFLVQATGVLVELAGEPDAGLARGRADIWAGGILYALGQDTDMWSPYGEPHVPPDQLARIVGASRASLIKRANEVRVLLGSQP